MFIDTHCHLSREDYDDIDKVIKEDIEAGVDKIVVSGCSRESIDEVMKLRDKYDIVYVTIGYHPEYADNVREKDLDYLKRLLSEKKVVGIGEIGLDYHYTKENRDKQIWLFEEQLKIAEEFNLPVVIHSRDATQDTINTLKKYRVKGIIHCFSGSLETAKMYISMGFLLGIGGVVTFKNSKLKDVVKEISLEFIVLETDSPYLAPVPYRGKVNSSKYLEYIAKFISDIKNISVSELAEITSKNASCLFDFNK
ncbi:MAG TPA: TatD family hydrolase [Candidatus Onthousia faecipullorum]|uniref:TatD family hydrolase n=1 Tax=Candidatus Onthousia faecipullorum TaxID=2840887 RepID=A0A9D1GB81_9FIRM|nr:TatD family hydrolase [Candidatus Onthousia faecipullorum]